MNLEHHPKVKLSDDHQGEIASMSKRHKREREKLLERERAEGARLENKLRRAHPESEGKLIFPQGEWLYLLPMPGKESGLVAVNGDRL